MSIGVRELTQNDGILHLLQIFSIIALAFLGGLSCCLSTWIIPLLRKSSSPTSAIDQFELMIEKGFLYLQTSSRLLAVTLFGLSCLTYINSNPTVQCRWRFWALALGILIPLAPYEIYFIFPSNYKITDLGRRLKAEKRDELRPEEKRELDNLLTKWQWRNGVRFTTPTIAAIIGLYGLLRQPKW